MNVGVAAVVAGTAIVTGGAVVGGAVVGAAVVGVEAVAGVEVVAVVEFCGTAEVSDAPLVVLEHADATRRSGMTNSRRMTEPYCFGSRPVSPVR